jgi:DNA-binding transcriptional MerR regulator
MATKYLRTSDLAQAVGAHPNTVRLYEEWGLIPPVERSPSGYRLFTQTHLDCLRLARLIYAAAYPGRTLRASGKAIIQHAVAGDWQGARDQADAHLEAVQTELARANLAVTLLEDWAQAQAAASNEPPLSIGEAANFLGVSVDATRNWERNGLLSVPRNLANGYRLFGKVEIERLRIIRMLSQAGYSHMAILRMFLELDGGNTAGLREALDTPRPDEDIFTAADRWLTTLSEQEYTAQRVIELIVEQLVPAGA